MNIVFEYLENKLKDQSLIKDISKEKWRAMGIACANFKLELARIIASDDHIIK